MKYLLASSFLPLAVTSAFAIKDVITQQALIPSTSSTNTTIPSIQDLKANITSFVIDSMSENHYYAHHLALKTLIGPTSYLILRQGEISHRESNIWDFMWKNHLECDWPSQEDDVVYDYNDERRIYLNNGKFLDANPERTPKEVIEAVEKFQQENNRNRYCNICERATQRLAGNVTEETEFRGSAQTDIPEEWLQYIVPEEQIEEEEREMDRKWKEQQKKKDDEILEGKWSVRDVVLPDLTKCERHERKKLY